MLKKEHLYVYICYRWSWKLDSYLKMDSIFLGKILVCFLLLDVIIQTIIFMTDVCFTLRVLLLYKMKASTKQFNCFQKWRWREIIWFADIKNLWPYWINYFSVNDVNLGRRVSWGRRGVFFGFPCKNAHLFGRVINGCTWYNSL